MPSVFLNSAAAVLVQSSTRIRMRPGRRVPKPAKGLEEGEGDPRREVVEIKR